MIVTVICCIGTASMTWAQPAPESIVPFRINVSNATLKDLKERLARTRFPSEIDKSGWDYGTDLAYLKALVAYWGASIVRQLGLVDREHLIGLHSNMCLANAPPGPNPNDGVPPAELKRVQEAQARSATELGYFQIQSTRPMTLGYGLNDSPAGLAAWIVEKFRAWSDSGGDVEKKFTKDELLTNVMIYWVTESAPSSVRLYFENRVDAGLPGRVEVPFACARFPREMLAVAPTKWIEAQYNVQQLTDMPRGGHFAAMEEPQLLVDDVRKFFRGRR